MSARPAAAHTATPSRGHTANDQPRRLIVGAEIELKGSISCCDELIIEGSVEADLASCLSLELREGGNFRGSAKVEQAVIAGHFDGELVVAGHLLVRTCGLVRGHLHYATLTVEKNGRIVGTMIDDVHNQEPADEDYAEGKEAEGKEVDVKYADEAHRNNPDKAGHPGKEGGKAVKKAAREPASTS